MPITTRARVWLMPKCLHYAMCSFIIGYTNDNECIYNVYNLGFIII